MTAVSQPRSVMDWKIRTGREEDAPILARLALMASHGLVEILYDGIFPELTIEEVIRERRCLSPGAPSYFENWRVALDSSDEVIGGINELLPQQMDQLVFDPIIPEERLAFFSTLDELDAMTENSLHINMLAVVPEYRGRGIATHLIHTCLDRCANERLPAVSLQTFEQDHRLVS